MHTKHRGWSVWLIIALALVWAGAPAPGTTADRDTPLKASLAKTAQELLIGELGLEGQAYQMNVLDVQIEATSARVDVELTTEGPPGEITETVHVFAIHDGEEITAIFREPSPAFYEHAWDVSPDLLPRERLLFWQNLWESEHINGVYAPDSDYLLPFTGGEKKYVAQDYNKHFDFAGNGWIVRAARGGQALNGIDSYGGYYTRITHSDGTYGWYIHFQANSWFQGGSGSVYNVSQGECLGVTGETGLATGPHLHFNVSTTSNNCTGCNGGCDVVAGCSLPYWVAVSFTEGSIPDGGYTPASQNSTAPCAGGCCCALTALSNPAPLLGNPVSPLPARHPEEEAVSVCAAAIAVAEPREFPSGAREPVLEIPSASPSDTPPHPAAPPSPPPQQTLPDERPSSSAPTGAIVPLSPPASANYILAHSVIGMGGGEKSSSGFTLRGTSGQTYLADRLQGSHYRLVSGFWGGADATGYSRKLYLPLVLRGG